MKLNLSVSKINLESLKIIVGANPRYRALQSRMVEWGIRRAIEKCNSGAINEFYDWRDELRPSTELLSGHQLCVSVDDLLGDEIKKAIKRVGDSTYTRIRARMLDWGIRRAVIEYNQTKSINNFYK